MHDILPPEVIELIENHFLAGVKRAEAGYEFSAADEDSLTGALGQALIAQRRTATTVGGARFAWETNYRKCRGRGRGAPEKTTGADGIFEIAVRDENGALLFRKGLPFQAKNGWRTKDARLAEQATDLSTKFPGSLVVNYSANGYEAFDAEAVSKAGGSRLALKQIRPAGLGAVLAFDFLACTRGVQGLTFDSDSETFSIASLRSVPRLFAASILTTSIQRQLGV